MMESREDWIHSQCKKDDAILAIGAADGWVWKGNSSNVVLLDINEFPPGESPRVVGDAHSLPVQDNMFDVVVLAECLEHVHNPILVLKEATRVAREKVVFTVPDEYHWSANHMPLQSLDDLIKERHQTPEQIYREFNPDCIKVNDTKQVYHNRWYTKEMLESQLEYVGLPYQIETIAYDGWSWFCGSIVKEEPEITSDELVKLNLGSFVDTFGFNWVNIDILDVRGRINPEHKFTQCDLRRGIPYPNNSVDLIYTSHLIEHLTLEEAHSLLQEIYRVLKPGGLVKVSTPDGQIILRHYLDHDMNYFNGIQPSEFIEAPTEGEKLSRLLFSGDYEHRGVYDLDMLKSFLMQAGFTANDIHSTSAEVSLSPAMQAETKNPHVPISLICEAVKKEEEYAV